MVQVTRLYSVPALEKGLDLIEALAGDPRPQSQAELARSLGKGPSEIFRMLSCLERRGYISKEPRGGRYRLSLRLYELAHTHSPVDELLRAAEAPMQALVRATEESCHLAVLSRGKLVVVGQADSPRRIRISVEVGGRFPLVRTASGRLLLAHLPPGELDGFLDADEDWAALSLAHRRRFLDDLIGVRRSGVFVGRSDLTEGIRDFAALVGNPGVGVLAALCVPSLASVGRPLPAARLRDAVRRAAEEITRRLGLSVEPRQKRTQP